MANALADALGPDGIRISQSRHDRYSVAAYDLSLVKTPSSLISLAFSLGGSNSILLSVALV